MAHDDTPFSGSDRCVGPSWKDETITHAHMHNSLISHAIMLQPHLISSTSQTYIKFSAVTVDTSYFCLSPSRESFSEQSAVDVGQFQGTNVLKATRSTLEADGDTFHSKLRSEIHMVNGI
jgi:hypothetical protein